MLKGLRGPAPAGGATVGSAGRRARDRLVDYAFVVGVLALVVVAALTSDAFFSRPNLVNVGQQMVTTGLISLGMLIVILTGGIDLSVGAIVAIAGITVAGFQGNMPLALAIMAALGIGCLAGGVNGFLVARYALPPFIVTLATLSTYRGLVYVYSETPITPSAEAFRTLLGGAYVGPVPVPVLIMLGMFALGWVFLNRTIPGRTIFAIGGNAEAVRLAGINVKGHTAMAYVISGFTAALAGVLLTSRLGIAQPNVGVAYELDAIAACVIGGAVLSGGRGSVLGTLGGVVTLALIDNLLNLYDVQSFYQQVLKGVIIVIAVLARRGSKAAS